MENYLILAYSMLVDLQTKDHGSGEAQKNLLFTVDGNPLLHATASSLCLLVTWRSDYPPSNRFDSQIR